MKPSLETKIVSWLIACALAGAFLQSILDPIDIARTRNTPKKAMVRARVARMRKRSKELELAFQ